MLTIVAKPLIQYAVEEAVSSGIDVLIFIIGRNKEHITKHIDRAYELENELKLKNKKKELEQIEKILPKNVQCIYIRQKEALGLGHAVLCSEPAVEDDPFAALDDDPFATEEEEVTGPQFIPKREFNIIEIREDLYFDRIHSRIYFDIQAISLYLPGDSFFNLGGFEKPIASFRFIDLYNLFKSMPKEAIWFNETNIAQHKNLGDAFLLRLFKGLIVKIANADDIRVSELYANSRKNGIMASVQVEQDLMEWESNLWEY